MIRMTTNTASATITRATTAREAAEHNEASSEVSPFSLESEAGLSSGVETALEVAKSDNAVAICRSNNTTEIRINKEI